MLSERDKERIKSLPRWASEMIERLDKTCDDHEARALAATSEDGKGTNTALVDVLRFSERGLPPDSTVRFRLDGGRITARVDGGRLSLNCPDGRIAIHPEVTNAISVVVVVPR